MVVMELAPALVVRAIVGKLNLLGHMKLIPVVILPAPQFQALAVAHSLVYMILVLEMGITVR